MHNELLSIKKCIEKHGEGNICRTVRLYPGIELMYIELKSDCSPASCSAAENIIQIDYCHSGQLDRKMKNGSCIYLNPGDFSLNAMKVCADSVISLPTGHYSGLALFIDIGSALANPPEPLGGTDIFGALKAKFCQDDSVSFLAGNEHTEAIFSGFYYQPKELELSYQKIKAIELLLYLYRLDYTKQTRLTAHHAEQVEIIREIHSRMIDKIGERVTIEELAKQYLINPTSLKTAFKAVYGNSIAAHIKEHRMKKAAEMLRETDMSIQEIAQAVGYDSQSKFTAAFKAYFKVLPKEYKKK